METLYPQLLNKEVWQQYLDMGFHLFPVNPWTKQPYPTEIFKVDNESKKEQKYGRGFLDAQNTLGHPDEIGTLVWLIKCAIQKGGHEYKGKYRPSYPQIGCATAPSGLFVIDIDVASSYTGDFFESVSWKALEALQDEYEVLPDTWTVQTPRGGRHLYYKGKGKSTTSVLGTGIDTRSEGGYIILPPSICSVKEKSKKKNKQGQYPHLYYGQYIEDTGSLEDFGIEGLPEWVLEVMTQKKNKKKSVSVNVPVNLDKKSVHIDTNISCIAEIEPWETFRNKEYPMEYFRPEEYGIGSGNCHNPLLTLAGLISWKVFTPERIKALMYEIWQTYCPEHDQNDVDRIIDDAIGWAEKRREETRQKEEDKQRVQSLITKSASSSTPNVSPNQDVEEEEVYDGYDRGIVDTLFGLVTEKLEALKGRKYMDTDIGNVRQFVDFMGSFIRYVPGVGFYVWNTKQWEQNDGRVHLLAERFAEYVTKHSKELAGPPYDRKEKKKVNTSIQNDRVLNAKASKSAFHR